ncbi:sulfite reductase subunit alpha [Variovorax sp. J22R133]|uniref:sulfite reductase subunit alpha n=1 Tax=Variovorax brevis TaxID=3053503 RepID=UPI0025767189|nr:sulfite reductase subunit alpha [Variovorax sp. J22R133]MDM0113181.1 sulfite reductase subunit alpha [Variovorax sp. J22R133]
MTETTLRILAACVTVLAYATLCLAVYRCERARAAHDARTAASFAGTTAAPPTLVLFASQTGQAEAIARQTAAWLHKVGKPVRVLSLNETDAATLKSAQRALFIASTYGEGDAPDGASVFMQKLMGMAGLQFPALRYAVLALGDRQYANFCGFGLALDRWLIQAGAQPEFARIDADNADPAALAAWRANIAGDDGSSDANASDSAQAVPWRLVRRELLNAGSVGTPVFHLGFALPAGQTVHWEPGDIAQVEVSADPGRPRDYSISSIRSDGELQLLVRQEQHADGTLGLASGLLTTTLGIGDSLPLRIRSNRNFRLGDNARRPLILIGNGTGIAGLHGHLRARERARELDNWLVFGERNAAHDFLYRAEIESWQATGVLRRLSLAFSRDQDERLYVQHRLLQASGEVKAWIDRGAAIYVCGSLRGMAPAVDAALRQIAGDSLIQQLTADGRYRRDVY